MKVHRSQVFPRQRVHPFSFSSKSVLERLSGGASLFVLEMECKKLLQENLFGVDLKNIKTPADFIMTRVFPDLQKFQYSNINGAFDGEFLFVAWKRKVGIIGKSPLFSLRLECSTDGMDSSAWKVSTCDQRGACVDANDGAVSSEGLAISERVNALELNRWSKFLHDINWDEVNEFAITAAILAVFIPFWVIFYILRTLEILVRS